MVFSPCRIWTLFTCYLHMYMSSAYYLSICVLYTHYLHWSFICSFLTDNADVIHMSSLVLFIYAIMYNLVSAHCLHRCIHCPCHLHVVRTCTHHLLVILYHSSYSLIIHNLVSAHCLHTQHIVNVICILFRNVYVMYMSSLLLLSVHMYMSSTYYLGIYVLCAHYLQWSLICSFLADNADDHPLSLYSDRYSLLNGILSYTILSCFIAGSCK